MTEVLRDKIEAGYLQLFCVDSIDTESFYCWWAHPSGRIQRHEAYESYSRKCSPSCTARATPASSPTAAASVPSTQPTSPLPPAPFSKLAAFSGRYDLTMSVEYFGDLLDGYYDDAVYFNTPTYLNNLDCSDRLQHLRNMDIVLTIGEADPFRRNNEHLSEILREKGIEHQLHFWHDRAHRGYYCRKAHLRLRKTQSLYPLTPLLLCNSTTLPLYHSPFATPPLYYSHLPRSRRVRRSSPSQTSFAVA